MVIFGSVFIKKSNETGFFKNRTETCSGLVRICSVFPVWLDFSRFGSVFSWFGFGSVFGFRFIKPKPNRTGQFFKNYNQFYQFFFIIWFFSNFFSDFSDLIGFLVFSSPLNIIINNNLKNQNYTYQPNWASCYCIE